MQKIIYTALSHEVVHTNSEVHKTKDENTINYYSSVYLPCYSSEEISHLRNEIRLILKSSNHINDRDTITKIGVFNMQNIKEAKNNEEES